MTQQHPFALKIIDFPVYRGDRLLINNVSFSLPHGNYLELQGQNGCGKTSLLRTLASIQESDTKQGTKQGTKRHAPAQSIFYFGHQSGFRPELKVTEQLVLSLQMYRAQNDTATIKRILKRVGLAHQLHAQIHQLSQGQIRRLMLAVMAHSGCSLWLIDEPFNALDIQGLELLRELLSEHFEQSGSAIIATHRSLDDALPALSKYTAGKLIIDASQAQFLSSSSQPSPPSGSWRTAVQGLAMFFWVLRREFKLMAARPQDIVWPSIFFWMTLTLFPFGIGTNRDSLAEAAGGIFWISALLATLIGATRFFNADYESGALANLKTARISFSLLTFGKVIAGWLFVGIPLSLASVPIALLYGLTPDTIWILFTSLMLGSISLAAFCSLFAALGLMARQAQIIICLLAFPVFVPLIIFGTTAVTGAQNGIGSMAPLLVLANLAVLSIIALPVLTGRVLSLALE
jgi:heme exporter protein B